MHKNKKDIRLLSLVELTDFTTQHGERPYRAKQIYEWLWKKNVASIDEMTNLSKNFRESLKENFVITHIESHLMQISADKTIKTVFRLYDGNIIESVLIPTEDRTTACISTQVGCGLDCKFCATAKMGFKRNLTVGEIYDQVFMLNQQSVKNFGINLTNIVLMGMGEPLLNYENVLGAINLITSDDGLEMSQRRITLSTIGIPKILKKLAYEKVKFNLAVSLHSANDEKRAKIILYHKKISMDELTRSLKYFSQKADSKITIEYILFKGFNDSIADAKELVRFCSNFRCKINIIEYNPIRQNLMEGSDEQTINSFIGYLRKKNFIVNFRKSRGRDIDAACGQLDGKIM